MKIFEHKRHHLVIQDLNDVFQLKKIYLNSIRITKIPISVNYLFFWALIDIHYGHSIVKSTSTYGYYDEYVHMNLLLEVK